MSVHIVSDGTPAGTYAETATGVRITGVTRIDLTLTPSGASAIISCDNVNVDVFAQGVRYARRTPMRRPAITGRSRI